MITHTTRVDVAAIDPTQFAATANLLQSWVPKLYDCRVTMVKHRPLAAAIGRHPYRQGGPRPLWDLVEDTTRLWYDLGRPAQNRFGLTVAATGDHRLWLDHPDGPSWNPATVTASGG